MLEVDQITRAFGPLPVLRGVSLTAERGEIICLLGPSGCGKTTLLRIIAGLEEADSGDLRIEGESILRTPVHERDFGLMFQDFALFPHLRVKDNVRFGLQMHGMSHDEQDVRVQEMLELVGMAGYEDRDVSLLSGGEKQRVALARSLAPRPRLLMLDEPMGSLDAALRERLVMDVRAIIKQLGLTAIYVTHDQDEAYAVADRIAVMNQGLIEQMDAPQALYEHPDTVFVAQFLGLSNLVLVIQWSAGQWETALGRFPGSKPAHTLLLHPDGFSLTPCEGCIELAVVVEERTYRGDHTHLTVRHGSGQLFAFDVSERIEGLPAVGQSVALWFEPAMIVALGASTSV